MCVCVGVGVGVGGWVGGWVYVWGCAALPNATTGFFLSFFRCWCIAPHFLMRLPGNGSIGLVHGFIGVCFAVEAFYGAARYDSTILLRCIVFQVVSMFICMAIGIAGFSQATSTCDGKANYSTCFAEVQLRSSLYLFGGGGFCFVFALVMLIFWRQMTVAIVTREAADKIRWRLQ